MVNALIAAALAVASPSVPNAPPQRSDPAMFVVRDTDTTIYIFGTFHALDGQSDWFRNEVRTAFDQSNELILETLIPDVPIAAPAAPIRGPSLTASASFLATTRMAIDAGRTQGMQVGNGADMVLRHIAQYQGKPVAGLETLESQLNMFTRLPASRVRTPGAGSTAKAAEAGQIESLSRAMAEMQMAWKTGDQSVFVRMLDQLNRSSPDTYRMMFTERNARWADWIAGRMQTPGTVFVAVGAGHLAGQDSLLVRLAQLGMPSRRVN